MDPAAILQMIMQLAPGVLNFLGPDPEARRQGDQVNALNNTDELLRFLRGTGISTFDPAREGLLGQIGGPDAAQSSVLDRLGGLSTSVGDFRGQIPGLFDQAGGIVDPRSLGPQATEVFDAAQGDIQNRGNTAQLTAVEDRLNEFRDANRAALGPVLQNASDIIGQGGRTAETDELGRSFQGIIDQGGQTDQTRESFGAGRDLVGSGGLTPALEQIMGQLQGQLQSGGLTPEGRRILSTLTGIIESGGQGGAVQLDDQAAISLFRDAAATSQAGQVEQAQAQAFNRNAKQDARLQNFGIATQGAGSILSDASRLMASANAGLGDVARATSANLATGAGLMSDAARTAAVNLATGTSGANANQANVNNRLGIGGNIFGTAGSLFNQSELGSAEGLLGVEQARRNQQNAAIQAMLGLGQQGLDARGQNITNTNNQVNQLLRALGLEGTTLSQEGNLASTARTQTIGANNSLLNFSSNMFGNLVGANQTRSSGLNTGQVPGSTRLQTAIGGFGAGGGFEGLIDLLTGGLSPGGGSTVTLPFPEVS